MVIFKKNSRGFKSMPIKFSEKELYSVRELEKILPITPLTIREYIRKGKIKGSKIGKNWYVKKQDLEAFLEGNKVGEEEG